MLGRFVDNVANDNASIGKKPNEKMKLVKLLQSVSADCSKVFAEYETVPSDSGLGFVCACTVRAMGVKVSGDICSTKKEAEQSAALRCLQSQVMRAVAAEQTAAQDCLQTEVLQAAAALQGTQPDQIATLSSPLRVSPSTQTLQQTAEAIVPEMGERILRLLRMALPACASERLLKISLHSAENVSTCEIRVLPFNVRVEVRSEEGGEMLVKAAEDAVLNSETMKTYADFLLASGLSGPAGF
jgi:hypothetical protein